MATKATFEMFFHLCIYLCLTWPFFKSDHHGCKSENKFSFTCPWWKNSTYLPSSKTSFWCKSKTFFSLYLTLVKGLDIVSLSETTINVKTNQIFRSVPMPLHQIGNRIVATIAFPWTWSKWKRSTSIFVPARALARTKILEKSKTRFVSHLLALSEGTWHCLSSSKTIMNAKAKMQ